MVRLFGAIAVGVAIAAVGAQASPGKPTVPLPPSELTVFEKPNFQGRSMTFQHQVASFAAVGFNDLATSVKISGQRDWVLCEHRNFMGKCVRVHLKEKDLKRQKFTGVVSSAYPVRD